MGAELFGRPDIGPTSQSARPQDKSAGSHKHKLRRLQDVDIESVAIANGQTLIWSSAKKKFVPGGSPSGTGGVGSVPVHEAASNPHPQYRTAAQVAAQIAGYSFLTTAAANGLYQPIGDYQPAGSYQPAGDYRTKALNDTYYAPIDVLGEGLLVWPAFTLEEALAFGVDRPFVWLNLTLLRLELVEDVIGLRSPNTIGGNPLGGFLLVDDYTATPGGSTPPVVIPSITKGYYRYLGGSPLGGFTVTTDSVIDGGDVPYEPPVIPSIDRGYYNYLGTVLGGYVVTTDNVVDGGDYVPPVIPAFDRGYYGYIGSPLGGFIVTTDNVVDGGDVIPVATFDRGHYSYLGSNALGGLRVTNDSAVDGGGPIVPLYGAMILLGSGPLGGGLLAL